MAIIDICASNADNKRELDEFESELSYIRREFMQEVDAVVRSDEAKTVNEAADEALREFEKLFATSPLGSLRAVQKDSGLSPVNKSLGESLTDLAKQGFLFANGRWFFCGTKTRSMRSVVSTTGSSYQGVLDGEFSIEQISELIPGYVDPNISDILNSQTPRRNSPPKSTALGVANDGALSKLRELYRHSNSDAALLKKHIESLQKRTESVFHSKRKYVVVTKPSALLDSEFTVEYVRTVVPASVEDYNAMRLSDDEYIVLLDEVASSDDFDSTLVVSVERNESTKNYAPLFVSRGFDETGLGPSSYLLGIRVNGIARVVDVTTDGGNRIHEEQYTTDTVASSIREIFADLVDCGTIGSEFYVTTKCSGGYATIEFFPVGEFDAYEALGLERTIQRQYNNTKYTFDRPLVVFGGPSRASQTSASFVSAVKDSKLFDEQIKSIIVNQASYWNEITPRFETFKSELNSKFTSHFRTTISLGTADTSIFEASCSNMSRCVDLTYLDGLRPWESLDIVEALGNDFHRVMCLVDVTDIDVYTSEDDVYTALTSYLSSLSSNGGVSNVAPTMNVDYPKTVNLTQLHTLQLLRFAMIESFETSKYDQAVSYYDRFQQASDMVLVYVPNTTASNGDIVMSYTSASQDYLNVVAIMSPQMRPTGVQRSITGYVKRNYPDAYNNMIQAAQYMRETNEYEQQSNSVNQSLSDYVVTLLQKADALLASVQSAMRGYATTYQQTYNKIMSLANIGMNVYSNQGGFQTKYLSCYVSGSASSLLGVALQTYLQKINELASDLNKMLQKIIKALRKYFDKIACIVRTMNLSISGYVSYSKVTTGFMGVQLNMNCILSAGGAAALDPRIASMISSILGRVLACLSMFELQLVVFEKQDSNTQAAASQLQADLIQTVLDALNRLTACLS